MAVNNEKMINLSSGYRIPAIGLGTSFSTTSDPPDPVEVENAVKMALQTGYRHIDCAPVYENEVAVGKGIKASGIPRDDLFITSKLWNTEHDPVDVGPALDNTLKDLGIDYVDLYLISIALTWAAMETLVETGKARSIGVSNFSQSQLEELLSTAKIPPAVNQIQAQPYRPKKALVAWCLSKNIHVTAWGPLTVNRAKQLNVTTDTALLKIAESINITPSQLALSWAIHRGTSVIPKSSNQERLRSNLKIVELSSKVLAEVDKLEILV